MSHQTEATMSVLSIQMNASTAYIKLEVNNQPIIASVAMFLARQCQGKGRRRDKEDNTAMGPSSGCMA
jgi:hypothetical protein